MAGRSERLTGWRRIASATWSAPQDPQIYGVIEVDATKLLEVMAAGRAAGHHLTPTHFVGRALSLGLKAVPELNGIILGERFFPKETVDIFFITAIAQGHDLSGVKVVQTDMKSIRCVCDELASRSATLKHGHDQQFARTKRLMDWLPGPVLRGALQLTAWATGKKGWSVPLLGLEAFPFGSAMVTSVGMLGLPMGFAPIAWLYQVPVLVLAGEISWKPIAIEGQVVIRPMLPITATIDHRYVDGWHLSQVLKVFRGYLADPAQYESFSE